MEDQIFDMTDISIVGKTFQMHLEYFLHSEFKIMIEYLFRKFCD